MPETSASSRGKCRKWGEQNKWGKVSLKVDCNLGKDVREDEEEEQCKIYWNILFTLCPSESWMHFCHSIPLVWMSAGDVLHLCLCIGERCPTLTSFVGHEQFRSLARFLLLVVIVVFRLHNTAITIYHRRSLPCSLEHDIGSWLWFRCNAIESAKLCCGGGMERKAVQRKGSE